MAGIYIHIPFCKQACHYCDFHFSTSLKLKDPLLRAMLVEIELHKAFFQNEEINTIYFGGGSPSILSVGEISFFLENISSCFNLASDPEITLEANPDDLDLKKSRELKDAGINRLSIGIQSFRDKDLKLMNRAHNTEMALKCIEHVRSTGFENLNIDLIYGIPGLSLSDWEENLEQFLKIRPEHLSAYNLTFEDRTAFGHWLKKGKIKEQEDEAVIDQFKLLMEKAKDAGYEHYEISNFSLPGAQSKHNTSYWKGDKYLGIGPSAHTYDGKIRRWNMKNNPLYIKAIENKQKTYEEEVLTEIDHFNEYILTSLRTSWGVDLTRVEESFGKNQLEHLLSESDVYIKSAQLKISSNVLILTEKGKLVADKITSDLFIV